MCSISRLTPPASGGASNGCSVSLTRSRTIEPGGSATHGISLRTPFQNFVRRHRYAGSHDAPDSISTTVRAGNLAKTPSAIRLVSCDWNAVAWFTYSSVNVVGQPTGVIGFRYIDPA